MINLVKRVRIKILIIIIIEVIFKITTLNLIIKRIRIKIISLVRSVIVILLILKEKRILYI